MAFSSYSFQSAESVARTFNAYSPAGDTVVRYQGATPTETAEAVWFGLSYVGPVVSSGGAGGGISIFTAP